MKTPVPDADEIKVAVIGYVSDGKTILLNAIFRDKYGEVGMGRTTAGVNLFRISLTQDAGKKNGKRKADAMEQADDTAASAAPATRKAKSTLKEITADNKALRELADGEVKEKSFEITLDEEVCEMRDNTQLVFVDVPGINEAGASNKYKNYVAQNWFTYDCVIVVMDGRHGVNSEERVQLLEFVNENLN